MPLNETPHENFLRTPMLETILVAVKYPNLIRCRPILNLKAFFVLIYLCESAFLHMKIIKSTLRSTMTGDLAASCYTHVYEKLASSVQCKVSH